MARSAFLVLAAMLIALSLVFALSASVRFLDDCFSLETWPCEAPFCRCKDAKATQTCLQDEEPACDVRSHMVYQKRGGNAYTWHLVSLSSGCILLSFLATVHVLGSLAWNIYRTMEQRTYGGISVLCIYWCVSVCIMILFCLAEIVSTTLDPWFPVKAVIFVLYAAMAIQASLVAVAFWIHSMV